MALSLSNVKLLLASVVFRRGYAAATQGIVSGGGGFRKGIVGKVDQRAVIKDDHVGSISWAPDPITGYYRPSNLTVEIDPVELRQMLLNHRVTRPH